MADLEKLAHYDGRHWILPAYEIAALDPNIRRVAIQYLMRRGWWQDWSMHAFKRGT